MTEKVAESNQVSGFLWWATGIVLAATALTFVVGLFIRAALWMVP